MRKSLDQALSQLEEHMQEENKSLKSQSEDLRKNGDSLREKLANYEDIIDKKINTDILPRIGHLDNLVSEFKSEVNNLKSDNEARFSDQA